MKTEKQVKTWWIDIFSYDPKDPMLECNCYHTKPKHWPKKPLKDMQLEVIAHEDHLAIVAELESLLKDLIGHAEAHLQFPHKDTSDLTLAIIKARQALAEDKE